MLRSIDVIVFVPAVSANSKNLPTAIFIADDVRAKDINPDECDGDYDVDLIMDEWEHDGDVWYLIK